jgi:hypothetical protein
MLSPSIPALVIKGGPSKEYFDGYTELHRIGLPQGEGPVSSKFDSRRSTAIKEEKDIQSPGALLDASLQEHNFSFQGLTSTYQKKQAAQNPIRTVDSQTLGNSKFKSPRDI